MYSYRFFLIGLPLYFDLNIYWDLKRMFVWYKMVEINVWTQDLWCLNTMKNHWDVFLILKVSLGFIENLKKKKKTKERKKKVQFLTGFTYTKSRIKWLLDLGAVSEWKWEKVRLGMREQRADLSALRYGSNKNRWCHFLTI